MHGSKNCYPTDEAVPPNRSVALRTCIPGCYPTGQQCPDLQARAGCRNAWCQRIWDCSFPPSHLAGALRAQLRVSHTPPRAGSHNEVVVDVASIVRNLPDSILGWYHTADADDGQRRLARDAHRAFMRAFNLTTEVVPLVQLDFAVEGEAPPFTVVEPESIT